MDHQLCFRIIYKTPNHHYQNWIEMVPYNQTLIKFPIKYKTQKTKAMSSFIKYSHFQTASKKVEYVIPENL